MVVENGWLKELVAPGVLVLLTALATFLFGKQKYNRDRSNTQLSEAQDSQQMSLMVTMRERETEALKRADMFATLYADARDELHRTREATNVEMATLRAMGERRDERVSRQAKQLAALARMVAVVRPELRDLIEESGFVALDDSTPTRRRTDPSALAGPVKLDLDLGKKKP